MLSAVPRTFARCLLLVSGLTACESVNPDLIPVEASAKAWVHQQNGQRLVFRNTTDATTQTLVVSRRDTVEKISQKLGARIPNEYIYLTYRRQAVADSGFSVVVYGRELVFVRTMKPKFNSGGGAALLARLGTTVAESEEGVLGPNGQLVRSQNPPTSLVRLEGLAGMVPYNDPTDLEQAYYSKPEGLVGYKTRDGREWQRQ